MFLRGLLGFGRDLSCRKLSLSSSCRIAMLANCSISLNVSLMLRNMEKYSSLSLVLTLMHSGNSSVAFFSSWVTSTHWITSVTEEKNLKNTIIATEAKQQPNRNKGQAACKLSAEQHFSPSYTWTILFFTLLLGSPKILGNNLWD